MFSFNQRQHTSDEKISRRTLLQAGSAGFAGLTLAEILRAEETAGRSSGKSVIHIHLDGGPPQLDTIDLKPQAPVEIRGEFSPIATSLPGVQICELLPKLAAMSEKLVYIRSLVNSAGRHDAFQCQSGFAKQDLESLGGRPALGCVLTKLWGSPQDTAPTFVDLMQGRALVRNSARPGFLGPSFKPFRPDTDSMFERPLEAGMQNELARLGADHSTSMTLNPSLTVNRLDNRRELLGELDRLKREIDNTGMMNAMDRFHQQAVGILTSGRFAHALDFSKEDPAVLARYEVPGGETLERFTTADNYRASLKFLLARRLIEAGVRCVSLSISDFDTHSANFPRMKHILPLVDHGLSTLISDLDERRMLDDVTLVVWGEFGRTPRVDASRGGRHHWPRVGPAIIAGGAMQTGQVIGKTDREGGTATERPVTYQDVFATVYRNLGIDPGRTTLIDPGGRPQYLLDAGTALPEVG